MSGIYGFVKIGNDDDTIAEGRVKGLGRWNRDYGRDGEGEVCGEGFAIGCFVEHFAEAFPAGTPVFEDGDLLYAIDAVIYNRDELDAKDGESDEEVIIRLIKNKGYLALKDVNGDFAGAVLNRLTGELKLFRDHLGVRQLYYYLKDGLLSFSTDIRGLGALPDADLKIDEEKVWFELAGYYNDVWDRTHFEYIKCVFPGSIILFTETEEGFSMSAERYFAPGQRKIRLENDEQYIARMRELVEDSIRRRLDAFPGRVGAELSGGLDSSVIDILINRMRPGGKYVAWRIVPDDWPLQPEDERIVIKDIVDQENLDCEYLPADTLTVKDDYNKVLPVFVNTNSLGDTAKLVSQYGIRVVFSGFGGDEGVSRRSKILELFRAHEYKRYLLENWNIAKKKRFKVLRFFYYIIRQMCFDNPRRSKPWHTDYNAVPVLNKEYIERMNGVKGNPFFNGLDPVRAFECGCLRSRPETASFQAAEYGVRYVYPYEDYRLFDYAISIPRYLFKKDATNRWIYRIAFGDVMPESLRNVNCKNFPSIRNGKPPKPFTYTEELRRLNEKLDSDRWRDYLDFDAVDKLIDSDELMSNKEEHCFSRILDGLYLLLLIQNFQDFCST